METPREISTWWMLKQGVRGGVSLSSASPMGGVKRVLGAWGMYIALWETDRYLQMFDNDHHTIVTARLVARVLPGFECRSGVLGLCVRRCLSHELGENHVWARPAVSVTSFCLETDQHRASSVSIAIFCVDICGGSSAIFLRSA